MRQMSGIAAHKRTDIHYAWSGSSIIIVDHHGRAGIQPVSGFYFRETRYLRELRFTIDGDEPNLCSAAEASHQRLEFAFSYPDGPDGAGTKNNILFRGLDLRLAFDVQPAHLEVRLDITSRWNEHIELDLQWHLSADYNTPTDAESGKQEISGRVANNFSANRVTFRFLARNAPYTTIVLAESGAAWRFANGALSSRLSLARQETIRTKLLIDAVDYQQPIAPEEAAKREAI
jgi:hypothetical protein